MAFLEEETKHELFCHLHHFAFIQSSKAVKTVKTTRDHFPVCVEGSVHDRIAQKKLSCFKERKFAIIDSPYSGQDVFFIFNETRVNEFIHENTLQSVRKLA